MYNIPTPDEYKEKRNRLQEKIMEKFIIDVSHSLQAGCNDRTFQFPDDLSKDYREKTKEIFREKGWSVDDLYRKDFKNLVLGM